MKLNLNEPFEYFASKGCSKVVASVATQTLRGLCSGNSHLCSEPQNARCRVSDGFLTSFSCSVLVTVPSKGQQSRMKLSMKWKQPAHLHAPVAKLA